MNYFQAYAPPVRDAIVAAWDSQLAQAAEIPPLAETLARSADLFPRFAAAYAEIRALPRGARRLLQRRLAGADAPANVPPEWRRRLATSLAGAALLLVLAQGVEAATITVTASSPDINIGDKKCSLIEAVINANNDDQSGSPECKAGSGADTIKLPKKKTLTLSYAYDSIYFSGLPAITSPITISGNGARIVGGGYGGFHLAAVGFYGDLTLQSLTLSGAKYYYGNGGAIVNNGTLKLDKVTISGNTAFGRGGGVYNAGSLTITNSAVSNNKSYDYGGGIFSSESLTISNSAIFNNTAYAGGGVFVRQYGSAAITNSTISGNSAADGRGGGIFTDYKSTLSIIKSTISGNSATGPSRGGTGGGIYTRSAVLTIDNSTISGNTVGSYYNNGGYAPYGSGGRGGGVFAGGYLSFNGTVTITNSTITGNSAESGSVNFPGVGGGVYNADTSGLNYLTLSHSLISGNTAALGAQIANQQEVTAYVFYDPPSMYAPYGKNSDIVTADSFNLFGSDGDAGIYNYSAIIPLVPGSTDYVPTTGVTTSMILSPVLKANGGPTKTHALAKGSPALRRVGSGCPPTDQRGTKRPSPKNTLCDIGSFEGK